MFRAFLGLSEKETKNMSIREFIDYDIVLGDVLKLWHAPYLNKE